ncbi:hypothetical protein CCR80_12560 [Rhodothalassium salexigens]|uniref:UPF0262 family protein n=1 Tax=Rhodothalassium salexigens TaxID=1086 RepID=UPI001912106C|nr:UPF0262 family protein [Rhodothalassium salexigens]MBK5921864.1 hypothetical protein [Rhodothalassium salexigens]
MTATATAPDPRLIDVTVDQPGVVSWNADIEHERRVAIFDLLETNHFAPRMPLPGGYAGPFKLTLGARESRLVFALADTEGNPLEQFRLSVTPFRRIIRDYFQICESYFEAIKTAAPSKIEAIDMGRRGVHNEGAELLVEKLADKVEMDFDTGRRLFTLVCVLHLKG